MEVTESILNGDIRTAARLMRDIDDEIPSAREHLKKIYPHTGRAYILGITGSPGTGKSTLVDKLVQVFREQGKTIGIIAVDPTSPFTGGAILGDRIRMQRHSTDDGVFIRSLATRGNLGGLSRSTNDIVDVLDAMGKDLVIVETVGVGQDEVDVVRTAHTTIVVLVPGMGDEVQAIKAGILEVGDVFVVNKADREGADKTVRELEVMLDMQTYQEGTWRPTIFKTQAIHNEGIQELAEGIEKHRTYLFEGKHIDRHIEDRVRQKFLDELQNLLLKQTLEKIEKDTPLDSIVRSLVDKTEDPYSQVEKVLKEVLK